MLHAVSLFTVQVNLSHPPTSAFVLLYIPLSEFVNTDGTIYKEESEIMVDKRYSVENYFVFSFSLLIKRQTHKTAKTTVAAINTGNTGIEQTPAFISSSP